jgi:hypothetical protein
MVACQRGREGEGEREEAGGAARGSMGGLLGAPWEQLLFVRSLLRAEHEEEEEEEREKKKKRKEKKRKEKYGKFSELENFQREK